MVGEVLMVKMDLQRPKSKLVVRPIVENVVDEGAGFKRWWIRGVLERPRARQGIDGGWEES